MLQVRTRAATLPQHVDSCEAILAAALRLLRPEQPIDVRLMGLRMSNFLEVHLEPGQRSIAAFVQTARPSETSPGSSSDTGRAAASGDLAA